MPAVFENKYVTRINGTNVKKGKTKRDLAEQLRQDIRDFKASNRLRPRRDRVVRVDRDLHQGRAPQHATIEQFEKAMERQRRRDRAVDALRLRRDHGGRPVLQRRAEPLASTSRRCCELANEQGVPISGKDFKTGQTWMKTIIAPGLKARMLGLAGWYSTNILGNRDGEVLDDPASFKTKEESKLSRAAHDPAARDVSRPVQGFLARRAHQLLPAARRQQGRLGQHRHRRVDGLPDADQGQLPLPRLDPRRADRARPRAVPRLRAARRHEGDSGMAYASTTRARWPRRGCSRSTIFSSSRRS